MKKLSAFVLTICFLLAGCSGLPFPSTSTSLPLLPKNKNFVTTMQATSINDSANVEKALTEVPMRVGYGVRGSWFELYFTDPVNLMGRQITGGLDGPLVAGIDSARLSVDVAIYSMNLNSIRDALIHAFRRGVQVRVVMESDNMDGKIPQSLIHAGIPILGDRREDLMHNKFVVIDRADIWTGSMNYTKEGVYEDNNNMICIHSEKVAEDYETEFNDMFVDDKFGPTMGAVTPNPRVIIDGTPLDIYFSPDDHPQAALVDLLDNAQRSIYFLAYSFTADPLGNAIRQRATAGIKVSGVMEAEQVASNVGTEYDAFRASGVDVHLDGNSGQMHHKVMIIDDQIVIMGSYNFTTSAEKDNDENLIVIYNTDIASQYLREFRRVYALAQP